MTARERAELPLYAIPIGAIWAMIALAWLL